MVPVLALSLLLSCRDHAAPEDPAPAGGDGEAAAGQKRDGGGGDGLSPAGTAIGPTIEECDRRACNAGVSDLCCPSSCSGASDIDCAGCGNGRIEANEVCDPPETCPTTCPQLRCDKQRLKSGGTCAAVCVSAGTQTECVDGDECCPDGCTAANDRDCASKCGNGTVEPGEICDPISSCRQSCAIQGCTILGLKDAGTCLARCVEMGTETACKNDDGCCPPGCNAASDNDCAIKCDNGVKEGKETCDPLSSCPQECPPQGCRLRRLLNAGTCAAVCVDDTLQTECRKGDGCCPVGCNAGNDDDCPSLCGNGIVEPMETCDPISSCLDQQRTCVSDAATTRTRMGDPGKCTFVCRESTRVCGAMDRACPPGCGPTQDPDCPGCGNGVIEPTETCDPPASCRQLRDACVSDATTVRTPTGDPDACTFACKEEAHACGPADGACPPGCTAARDPDCVGCGNGRLDPGETCDPVSQCQARSAACVSDASTIRTRQGDPTTCRFTCKESARACGPRDGQCPPGCGPTRDPDCPGCGNGAVEPPETCDPCDPSACVNDADNVRTPTGDPAKCTFTCTTTPRGCVTGDKFCPSKCTRANDGDCLAAPGDPCKLTSECAKGTCVDNRCCVQTCATCQACTGTGGTCVNIVKGMEDQVPPMACAGGATCDGAGKCVQPPPCSITAAPAALAFGSVPVNTRSRNLTTTITNGCPTTTGVPSVAVVDPNEFVITGNSCATVLAPGATCAVGVTFIPRGTDGRKGTLTVAANPGGKVSVDLSGTGTAAPAALQLVPADLDFSFVLVGSSSRIKVTLTNRGNGASGTITIGSSSPPFTVDRKGCTTLAPGASCEMDVIFTPPNDATFSGVVTAQPVTGTAATTNVKGTGTVLF